MADFPDRICLLAALLAVSPGPLLAAAPTFNRDIAPIFYEHCTQCHRPGDVAPMSLLDYKSSRAWAKSIREAVITRKMPPWFADPQYGHFSNDARLSKDDIATIRGWVDGGALEGDPKDLPKPPAFAEGWRLGPPDVVIDIGQTFQAGAGSDTYEHFIVPTNFTEGKWIRAADLRPGNRSLVHHAHVNVVSNDKEAGPTTIQGMKALDRYLVRDGKLTRIALDAPVLDNACQADAPDLPYIHGFQEGALASYLPGRAPDNFADGAAKWVPAGAKLEFVIHYAKTAAESGSDRTSVGLYFAPGPPARVLRRMDLRNFFFLIPPGAKNHEVKRCYTFEADKVLLSITPHMHYRARDVRYDLTHADGRREVLLAVPHYNFNWQLVYRLQDPLLVEKGSQLMVTAHYDNPGTTPLRWGDKSEEEMMTSWIETVPGISTSAFLNTYCMACHKQKFKQIDPALWTRIVQRVANVEMPPKGAPAPSLDQREQFSRSVAAALHAQACAAGNVAAKAPLRRLNRDEYAATLRDLLDIQVNAGQVLPADGAGGEGFDNAAETLFLSPLHSEKYLEAAKLALDYAAKEYKSRARILIAKPGPGVTPKQAAQQILKAFLPRAFRHPVDDAGAAPYLELFQAAQKQGQPFEPSIFFALRAALVSPQFLFRVEPAPLDQYALASRLSYFLWGSMPDELLFDLASEGKLQNEEVLKRLVQRMLRNDRSFEFAGRFVEQWLRTRELAGDKAPDPVLFPNYASDEELRGDIRLQPVLFFREILLRNLSLLNLIDSRYTIGTSNLAKHFAVKLPLNRNASKQPQWVELPEDTHRGGLLGMPAVLAVSSYPYRTSPVLRGAWILDAMLGTPPPPPPPDVPALEDAHNPAAATTVRERLTRHRANPTCAGCHSRIDPLGFALENFDPIGRWRDQESGKPVDNSAEMMDGTKFQGPDQLKQILLSRKELFIRNLTAKLLGYALGRGLTLQDSCAVDTIVEQVKQNNYSAQSMIEAIVLSAPFRQKEPATP